jgi:hypothetical protein
MRFIAWVVGGAVGVTLTLAAAAFGLYRLMDGTQTHCSRGPAVVRGVVAEVSQAAQQFAVEQGRCPEDTRELVKQGNLRRQVRDAWGNELRLFCRTAVSSGPDRSFGTADDIASE